MTTAAKMTMASKLLVTLHDPTGRKRARARQRLMRMAAAAAAGALIAALVGVVERRRRLGRAGSGAADGSAPETGSSMGPFPGSKPIPMDKLTASAERVQSWGADEPGFRAHLGFGVGGTIPADAPGRGSGPTDHRVGESMPTAGGDALGGTVRGGDEVGYADEIVTGAGEAISNSTTPAQNGHGTNLH